MLPLNIFLFLTAFVLQLALSLIRKQRLSHFLILSPILFFLTVLSLMSPISLPLKLTFLVLSVQLQQLSIEDIEHHEVSFIETLFIFPSVFALLFFQNRSLLSLLFPGLFGFTLIFLPFLLSRRKGLGVADVIIFSALSLTLSGFEPLLIELFSAISAILINLPRFFFNNKKTDTQIPYLPFISFGWWLVLVIKTLFPEILTIIFPSLPF